MLFSLCPPLTFTAPSWSMFLYCDYLQLSFCWHCFYDVLYSLMQGLLYSELSYHYIWMFIEYYHNIYA